MTDVVDRLMKWVPGVYGVHADDVREAIAELVRLRRVERRLGEEICDLRDQIDRLAPSPPGGVDAQ